MAAKKKSSSKNKGRKGRPSRCTPDVTKQICEYLAEGNYPQVAMAMVDLTERTYSLWRKHGADELSRRENGEKADPNKDKYVDFLLESTRALAKAEAATVVRIQRMVKSDDVDPRVRLDAEKFMLTHRFSKRWGKNQIDVQVSGGIELKLNLPTPKRLGDDDDE